MQKVIYTSYFGNYRNIPSEYQCISIANSKPRIGIPTWCNVVPNWKDVEALKKQEITAEDFIRRYCAILNKISVVQVYEYLCSYTADTIVLLCYEKHYFNCHRYLLALWLKQMFPGLQIDEYPSEYYVPEEAQIFTKALKLIENSTGII